jgi:oxygen-independent coproporphyrinogen-3 oxidase
MSIGLYLHFPFCRNRCAYCDFYKEVHDPDLEVRYFEALGIETQLAAQECDDRELATIYVGGGTPSLANLRLLGDWLDQIKREFLVPREVEFSFECNPESVNLETMQTLSGLGVSRLIFGVQSFQPKLLKTLGRRHRLHDTHQAVYLANALEFDTWGIDLIFGLPGQTAKLLSKDLISLTELEPPHVSFYQLTVELGTALAEQVVQGKVKLPGDELSYAFYRAGCEHLSDAGYERYEVSSFAKPGHACAHNIGYWEGRDYLGLGPAAHSFMNGRRYANARSVSEYIAGLNEGRRPVTVDESGVEARMIEAIMLGLRTAKGIDRTTFLTRFGCALDSRLRLDMVELLVKSGHLIDDERGVRLTDDGFFVADEIIRRIIS